MTVSESAYQLYRATAPYVSADGLTFQFEANLKAGDPSSTAAMNAVPALRETAAQAASAMGAVDYGRGR